MTALKERIALSASKPGVVYRVTADTCECDAYVKGNRMCRHRRDYMEEAEMTQALATKPTELEATMIESIVVGGDLDKLSPSQRLDYYQRVCESLGLNPLTKPFAYIKLNGRLTLYASRDATDQLRKLHSISVTKLERETINDIYVVTAYAKDGTGREDSSIGAVSIKGLVGENLANAFMKAETKSKRRVTLSLAGLGWLDETEAASIPHEPYNASTGEIMDGPWTTKELSALLKGSALTVKDLSPVLGIPLDKDNVVDAIDRWLGDEEGRTLPGLVGLAASYHAVPKDEPMEGVLPFDD